MTDLFIVDFGGDDEARHMRAAEQAAEQARLRGRYAAHLVDTAGVDNATAEQAIAAIFDHRGADGDLCRCRCHPQLSSQHDDGFDCSCTWDEPRRQAESERMRRFWDSPVSQGLAEQDRAEAAAIAEWLAGQQDVAATRTSSYAPEQWIGEVDGHSFYFRERHGMWRIELDLEPNGHFANRLVGTDDDGKIVTEPVELTEGEVIAEGVDSALGATPVEHVELIVRTIRDHLWGRSCDHHGALFFCPKCGARMTEPS